MPAPKNKPPVAKAPPTVVGKPPAKDTGPKIVYDHIEVNGIPIPEEQLRFTDAMATFFLGWESEEDAISRAVKADATLGLKTEKLKFGNDFLLKDEFDQKIRCSRNVTNRDFRERDCRAIAQSILTRQFWFNGETIIIGEYGNGLSLQHRCIALKLAVQMWKKDGHWGKYWKEEPFIHTLFVTGVKENQEVVQTLDTGVVRILADAYATSGRFDDWTLAQKPLDKAKRTEASRLLDTATDTLWKRTGASLNEHLKYQTHAASSEFLDRHIGLVRAAKHLFEEDQDRGISIMKLSRGQCAALCYLMATSASEREAYDSESPPSEANLDFSRQDKAEEFWCLLSPPEKDKSAFAKIVSKVVNQVVNGNFGTLELADKKLVVVINAWNQWISGKNITEVSIAPKVKENSSKEKVLDVDEMPTLGGIDLGQKPEKPEEEMTAEEIQQQKDDRAKLVAEKAKAGRKGPPAPPATPTVNMVEEAVTAVRSKYPDSLVLFKISDGGYVAWQDDAAPVAAAKGAKTIKRNEMDYYKVAPGVDLPSLAAMLRVKTGKKILVAENEGQKITDITPVPKPTPAAKPVPAPVPLPAPAVGPKKLLKKPVVPTLKGGTGK